MKKLFASFKISDDEKITEKSFTFNIVASVVGVLLCLTSLTAATWAWFGDSVTSPVNEVQTGQYSLDVSVTPQGGAALDPEENGSYMLTKDVVYSVTLKAEGNVSTGYCMAKFSGLADDESNKFYSVQIFTNERPEKTPKEITFLLTAAEDCDVSFSALWGTLAKDDEDRDFQDGGAYVFNAAASDPLVPATVTADNGSETEAETETTNGSDTEAASQTE